MGIKERWRGFLPLPKDIEERIAQLSSVFRSNDISLAYLFGSFLNSKTREDLDLAVWMGEGDLVKVYNEITRLLGTERLDLVDLRNASLVTRFEIIRTGKLIFKKDSEVENRFEMAVLREYQDTEHLRKSQWEILEKRMEMWSFRKK